MNRIIFVALFAAMLPAYGQSVNEDLARVVKDLSPGAGLGLGQGVGLGIGQGYAFQTFGSPTLPGVRVLDEGFGNQIVKNRPFSATEERHFVQTLGDGTRIENMQTNRLSRDSEGRTRVEDMNGKITIYDPVAKVQYELDPPTKTARKQSAPFRAVLSANGTFSGYSTSSNAISYYSTLVPNPLAQPRAATMQGVMSETTENLGTQNVNGAAAEGVRTTMIIPKGQIGNSKDIKVVTEHWSSNDLQMLVKSVNSDPRFGDTTYQLTKITQSAPDAALFQVPADYTVTEGPAFAPKLSPAPRARGAGVGVGVGAGVK